jgi:hypothetical protein
VAVSFIGGEKRSTRGLAEAEVEVYIYALVAWSFVASPNAIKSLLM